MAPSKNGHATTQAPDTATDAPLKREHGRSRADRRATPLRDEVVERDNQARVLVADDDPDMRRMIARSLRKAGYAVVEVADGRRLLEHLGNDLLKSQYQEPDLVVSDIRMPGYSGLEVLAGLRRANWAMPVILITAFGDRQTHEMADRLGAATLLDKPFELEDLVHAVEHLLPPRF